MKNIEKYKEIVLKHLSRCNLETDIRKQGGKAVIYCPHTSCEECKEKLFKWLLEEYKEPILDDVERKYLSDVIRPFRKDICTIAKYRMTEGYSTKKEYIIVTLKTRGWSFPSFKAGTMYKGMKPYKEYTLKELGL